jgi:hypothetical protein
VWRYPSVFGNAKMTQDREMARWRGLPHHIVVLSAADNNPDSVCRVMHRHTLDRYKDAIELSADWN